MQTASDSLARPVHFDPTASDYRIDPYRVLREIRSTTPVCMTEPHGFLLLTRYRDVYAALTDLRLGHLTEDRAIPGERSDASNAPERLVRSVKQWLLFKNPPEHTRLRRLILRGFRQFSDAELVEMSQDIAGYLVDQLRGRDGVELIMDYAFLMPLLLIAELLGAPAEDRPKFIAWAKHIWSVFDFEPTDEGIRKAGEWVSMIEDYLRPLLARRRAEPWKDLISGFAAAEHEGETLTDEEIVANCVLLLFAGHDTTTHLIGNGMLALLQNPAQLERVRAQPDLLAGPAVAELLRYESPQHMGFRWALEDFVFEGVPVARRQKFCVPLAAANRDPDEFRDPDELDVMRFRNKHLGFAAGIHRCAGSHVASIQTGVAIRALLEAARDIQLREYDWEHTIIVRGLEKLRVEVTWT